MLASVLLLCLSVPVTASESYSIADTFIGAGFFNWTWETFSDPTHGRVKYVDKATAMATNLSDSFLMRADNLNVVPPADPGRRSVRISSPSAYTDSVLVLDLWHMPAGCSTWPAWWTVSHTGPWPQGGEIDIIEGVNRNSMNLGSLHTTPNCNMIQTRNQSGQTVSTVCDASVNYNQGCGVEFTKPNSYGQGFNSNGGGWFAMQRASCGIYMWFWSRNDFTVPLEVVQGLSTVNPDPTLWGVPDAAFPSDQCDYASHFNAHNIVFDLTFCGDWAGSAYGNSSCPSSCEDYVDNNPKAFDEAYWEISSLRVYTPNA
ncbi:nucleophile-disabled Lam16a mutant holds Laminariheptaose in A cyclical conformation [Mycena rosella]|uniref:Nucleophile-disabled Lam16a mutant holds Laminariheptaose in A cyclical conformation n=1 Tax=Mycena rosella TaxID=1033263 RepID=A0AAD7E0S6_MYCRO|nr:nucleophile-disabled Lam16a mutant holds Laminariheptaose in A cyclical conformation [Mycena rosella]